MNLKSNSNHQHLEIDKATFEVAQDLFGDPKFHANDLRTHFEDYEQFVAKETLVKGCQEELVRLTKDKVEDIELKEGASKKSNNLLGKLGITLKIETRFKLDCVKRKKTKMKANEEK